MELSKSVSLLRQIILYGMRTQRYQPASSFTRTTAWDHPKPASTEDGSEDEFRTYEIPGLKPLEGRKRRLARKRETLPPRFLRMKPDQDWTNVWPTAATFKWSAIPFPIRQGVSENTGENEGVQPGKYGNAELMKVPNFLHLTPAHIKKHCQAIKGFCTPWPDGLETRERCEEHLPVEIITSDYCFSGPTLRDRRARTVTLKIKLSSLNLDYHARDKFIRLVGDRYDKTYDEVTIVTDRCPLKLQNYEFSIYLLTVLYFESNKLEAWETDEKTLADMETYFWDLNQSRITVLNLLRCAGQADRQQKADGIEGRHLDYLPENLEDDESLVATVEVQAYRDATTDLFREGENVDTISRYKEAVIQMLNAKPRPESAL